MISRYVSVPGGRITSSRERSWSVLSSAARASAAAARSMARPSRIEMRTDRPRNTNSTTTYSSWPITNVSYGGRKKKLKTMKPRIEVKTPGPIPPIPAAATTTTRNPNPFVSGSMSSRIGRKAATSATVPARPTA